VGDEPKIIKTTDSRQNDVTTAVTQPPTSPTAELPPDVLRHGTCLDHYLIERVVGMGGGGVVYAAQDLIHGRRVAIKVMRGLVAKLGMHKHFEREIEALGKLDHPNIVKLYGRGKLATGLPYYAMEWVEGVSLSQLLATQYRIAASEALPIFAPLCRAVQAAHEAGFVHLDLKAANVLVASHGGQLLVKLLDFGSTRPLDGYAPGDRLGEPAEVLGSMHNIAPEQLRLQSVDQRADVYALGVLLYQLLTGRHPFDGNDLRQVALLHLQALALPPSAQVDVPPAVDAVVLRCMEKRREARFSTVAELLWALEIALDHRFGP
jgi:serine/threonine protein kinase